MTNFFIDSTLLFSDPFMENPIFLMLNKITDYHIYISDIVIQETENNITKQVKKINNEFEKLVKDYKKFNYDIVFNELDVKKEIDKFNYQLKLLIEKGIAEIVKTDNELLPIVVHRAIYRIMPFTEKKQEFRDSLIWLSYINTIKKKNLLDNILITNNTLDYLDKNNQLHPDLKNDCDNIRVFKNFFEYISKEHSEYAVIDNKSIDLEISDEEVSDAFIDYAMNCCMDYDRISNYCSKWPGVDMVELDYVNSWEVLKSLVVESSDELYICGKISATGSVLTYFYTDHDYYNNDVVTININIDFIIIKKKEKDGYKKYSFKALDKKLVNILL